MSAALTGSKLQSMEDGYRAPQVCNLAGITYRQLDYWARTGLVTPSVQEAQGAGSWRLYSRGDLLTIEVIKRLLNAGISLKTVRRGMTVITPELENRSEDLIVLYDGRGVHLVRTAPELSLAFSAGIVLFGIHVGAVAEQLDRKLGIKVGADA